MARRKSPQTSINPIHITGRSPNREPFPIPLDEAWRIMEDFLYMIHHQYDVRIHSFVLMPNHFHLLASSHEAEFGKIMQTFMYHTSLAMNHQAGRINQRWGNRHFRCELQTHYHLMNTYKYVYQNPMRAGLVSSCENWKYSTLHGLLGKMPLIIPIEEDPMLFGDYFDWKALTWLNTPINKTHLETIRSCLRKTKFSPPADNANRKTNYIDMHLI